jgi:hypothetical protein
VLVVRRDAAAHARPQLCRLCQPSELRRRLQPRQLLLVVVAVEGRQRGGEQGGKAREVKEILIFIYRATRSFASVLADTASQST